MLYTHSCSLCLGFNIVTVTFYKITQNGTNSQEPIFFHRFKKYIQYCQACYALNNIAKPQKTLHCVRACVPQSFWRHFATHTRTYISIFTLLAALDSIWAHSLLLAVFGLVWAEAKPALLLLGLSRLEPVDVEQNLWARKVTHETWESCDKTSKQSGQRRMTGDTNSNARRPLLQGTAEKKGITRLIGGKWKPQV